jgi:amiloride-sensitive sodium channel
MSSLTIYFKSDSFITSVRNELYGPMDFLANFGGLLGLFTGFSFLSLMEIFYFLTIRLFCNTRLYGRWSGQHS